MPNLKLSGVEVVRGKVLPEWIDVNEHMNVAYYILAFDQAVDSLWEELGITRDHLNVTDSSTFAVETHITWQRELALDEPYIITTQLLAYDSKRIHQFMRMYHADKHYLASTAEWLNLHVDLSVRKVSPWPEAILDQMAAFARRQSDWGWPAEAGKQMKVRHPIYSNAVCD
ncbi:MAG: thioesterase family protein [Woeseiaceae bacterium]|nr:thioesterase family protein [Woeseiaceae bacterium]